VAVSITSPSALKHLQMLVAGLTIAPDTFEQFVRNGVQLAFIHLPQVRIELVIDDGPPTS
jgi:hypothetical protein